MKRTIEKLYCRQRTRFQVTRTLEDARQILAEYDWLHPVSSSAPEPAPAETTPPSQ